MLESSVPVTIIEPGRGGVLGALAEAWRQREILYFLAWRDLKVRYRQTVLGALWAVIQPVVTMVVFTLVFNRVGGIRAPGGIPYPVFVYAGLLPWILFQSALVQSSGSVVAAAHLISKVYFPRLLVPLATVVSGLVDFAISFAVLLVMIAVYANRPGGEVLTIGPAVLLLPAFVLLAVLSALAVGLWLAALNVRYRDFRYVVPFLAQVWLFASPVAYSSEDVLAKLPGWLHWVYSLNPMVAVLDGFRWALLGQAGASAQALLVSGAGVIVVLLGGLLFFRRTERVMADLL